MLWESHPDASPPPLPKQNVPVDPPADSRAPPRECCVTGVCIFIRTMASVFGEGWCQRSPALLGRMVSTLLFWLRVALSVVDDTVMCYRYLMIPCGLHGGCRSPEGVITRKPQQYSILVVVEACPNWYGWKKDVPRGGSKSFTLSRVLCDF